MANIIRLTESDLHNIVRNTVRRIMNEENEGAYLSAIENYVRSLIGYNNRVASLYPNEDNELEFELEGGYEGVLEFHIDSYAYVNLGWKSNDYDQPDDADEIVDEPEVSDVRIYLYDPEGEEVPIQDNGTIKNALQDLIEYHGLEYDWSSLPSSEDVYGPDPDGLHDDPDSSYWRNRN